jgi:hypothetical protein
MRTRAVSNWVSNEDRISEGKGAIIMVRGHKGSSRIESVGSHSRVIVVLSICLAIAIVAAGLLVGCGSETSQEPSTEVQAMLQDRFEFMSAGDTQAVAKCYAANAVLDNYADFGNRVEGATAIADYFGDAVKDFGIQWTAEGDAIQYDRYVIQRVSNSQIDGTGTEAAIHILDVDSNGQIAHEWIVGWGR